MPEYNRVTSVRSDRVSEVRGLQSRNGRRKARRFLVEGPQAVSSAIAAGVLVHELFVAEDAGGSLSPIVSAAEAAGARITLASGAVIAAMAETQHPQGVLAVCSLLAPADLGAVMSSSGPVVVLEAMADPGNVGTVIRTADAVGAGGVVLTEGSADVHSGKVVRATAGSLFHLPIASGHSMSEVIEAAHERGRPVAVLASESSTDLFAALTSGEVSERTVWVIGNEAHGASQGAKAGADLVIRIPMSGQAESLNAAVAAAAVLYVTRYASANAAAKDSQ